MDIKFTINIVVGVLAAALPCFVTLYLYRKRNCMQKIVVVDDDLGSDATFLGLLRTRFNAFEIKGFNAPDDALRHIKRGQNVKLCLVDIVLRDSSSFSSVALARHCLAEGIKILIMTGHAPGDLGLHLKEFEKIGLSRTHILRKPATIRGYEKFLDTIAKATVE